MRKYFITYSLLIFTIVSFAQSETDSLLNLINNEKDKQIKVELLNELAIKYRRIDLDTSIIYSKQASEIIEKTNDNLLIIITLQNYGKTYLYNGEYENAIKIYEKVLKFSIKIENDSIIALGYHNIGNSYLYLSNYDEALKSYIEALKIREEINDIEGIAATTNNIGLIYWRLKNFDRAIEYYEKSLSNEKIINNKKGIASSLNNIGLIYWSSKEYDKSLAYFEESLVIKEKLGDINGIASSLNNIGLIYKAQGQFENAIVNFKKSKTQFVFLNKQEDIANINNNIGSSFYYIDEPDSALFYLSKALVVLEKLESKEYLIDSYMHLSNIYHGKKDYKKAYNYMKKYSTLKLEIFDEQSSNQVAEMETKYETNKKEKEIEIQNLTLEQNGEKMKLQRKLIYLFIIFFVIVVVFIIFLIKLFIGKKKANQKLEQRNAEILQQQEEIITQANNLETAYQSISQINEELVQQKDYIEEQSEIIKETNEHTQASIRYALTIQKAILPIQETINNYFDNFILYRPKDIVSGDFYWFVDIDEKNGDFTTYIAVVDCTGHGVPGAFMSMIANRLLNAIVLEKQITSPAKILTELNKEIIKSLKQDQTNNRDGMDMCLCKIESSNNEYNITFEGAKRDLIYWDNQLEEFKKIKATRKSIGGTALRMKNKIEYSDKSFRANAEDVFYLTTDGFIDQNNEERKRYGTFRLLENLNAIKKDDLQKQKEFLEKELDKWQTNTEQRDDITIIALKLK